MYHNPRSDNFAGRHALVRRTTGPVSRDHAGRPIPPPPAVFDRGPVVSAVTSPAVRAEFGAAAPLFLVCWEALVSCDPGRVDGDATARERTYRPVAAALARHLRASVVRIDARYVRMSLLGIAEGWVADRLLSGRTWRASQLIASSPDWERRAGQRGAR